MPAEIVTTLPLGDPEWRRRTRLVDRSATSPAGLVRHLLREAPTARALVLNGVVGRYERYSDLVAAALASRRRDGPVVLLSEVNWKRGAAAPAQLARRLGARAGPSPDLPVRRLARRPHHGDARMGHPRAPAPRDALPVHVRGAGAGRAGHRGRRRVRRRQLIPRLRPAAGRRPGAAGPGHDRHQPDRPGRARAPRRRSRGRAGSARAVHGAAAGADVVVVPVEPRTDRSAGEQTCVNAMALGKLVVVSGTRPLREYVEDGGTGFIVPPGDAEALHLTLRWALDPANAEAVARIREGGRREARERFSPARYAAALLEGVETAEAVWRTARRGPERRVRGRRSARRRSPQRRPQHAERSA